MNLLNGFVDKGSDNSLLKSLFLSCGVLQKSNLVPKKVLVNGKNGPYYAIRNVNPTEEQPAEKKTAQQPEKKSMKSKFKEPILGHTTKLGTKITSFDDAHFFKRVVQRHPKPKDVTEALMNPQFTRKGSNENGSTEYWGNKFVVVVVDGGNTKGEGQVKTVYRTNTSRLNRNLSDLMLAGAGGV